MVRSILTISSSVLAAAAFLSFGATAAEDAQTPTTLAGGRIISVEEGKKLLDAKASFVDTRSVVNFGKGLVPGALTAAYKEKSDKVPTFDAKLDSFELDKLPKDKSAAVVIYSDGPSGWKSYKAAVLAIGAGWKSVHYMRGGMADWTASKLPVER
jgi:rhodanese-related sulfurtransferase